MRDKTTCLIVTNVIKFFATCQSLWKHRQQKDAEQKKDIIGKTINIADTRGGFDSKSTTTNILPKEIEFLQIKTPGSRQKNVVK